MNKYVFLSFIGFLGPIYSLACGDQCIGADYYIQKTVTSCHHDCQEYCSTIKVIRTAPVCIKKIKSQIDVLSDILYRAQIENPEITQ